MGSKKGTGKSKERNIEKVPQKPSLKEKEFNFQE